MAPHDMAGQNALLYHSCWLDHKASPADRFGTPAPVDSFWLIT